MAIAINAAHWLPELPAGHDNIFFWFTEEELATPAGKIWLEKGNKYWEIFIKHRQEELRNGGRLFISSPTTTNPMGPEDVRVIADTKRIKGCLNKVLDKHGLLSIEAKMNMPMGFRQLRHYEVPFKNGKTSLKLVENSAVLAENLLIRLYKIEQDELNYAKRTAGFIRGISEEVLKDVMKRNNIEDSAANAVLADFYEKELIEYFKESAKTI
eukprot:TRINITY_DN13582_c0_g1_i1.p2 TRINITY_DN13582_c0_g1~~TRINITY_DN13582_c0_g1_i1.p2  ORF type:complete len:212 (+),score=35.01 TRINITY_DN13582_c0_g1_i1:444-1079(+)